MIEREMSGLREMIVQMPTEKLDEMLLYELGKTPVNEAAVCLIMDVLEERDQDTPVEINDRINTAWERYQAYTPVKERSHISVRGWPMRAVAAAAIIVLLVFAVMPQNAEADGFWDRLSRWTESIFEFFTPGGKAVDTTYVFETDNPGLQQVYDAVTDLGVTDPVVPMWLPDGYELVECEVSEMPSKTVVYARFKDGADTISLDIALCNTESLRQYSKDETNVITHEIADVVHNILRNNSRWTTVWTKDRLECAIYIDCQEETLYKILKSIYTMEAD